MKTTGMAASVCLGLLLLVTITAARSQDAIDRLDMKAHAAFDAGQYQDAIRYWSAALKIDPNNSTDWYNRACAYAAGNETDKALADYTEAIRLDPADPSNYIARGSLYNELRQPDKAIADYTELIKLDPKSIKGYVCRAGTYGSRGDWDKAIADYNQLIALNPNDGNIYFYRAQACFAKGDWDKTIADTCKVLELTPGNVNAIALRGNAYANKGSYDKAIADYNQLMTNNPEYGEGYNAEAWLFATCPDEKIRNGPKALELAQKACELSQWHDASFIDTLAAAEAETGKWDDALKHAKQAVEAGKAANESDSQIKDYASRIPLYEQKQPYRDVKK